MGGLTIKVPEELLERYATSAPRYTSYPTAVDWNEPLDVASYPAILEEAASVEDPCAVYMHVPFCEERCLFCGCNVFITRDHSRADTYLDRLLLELAAVARSGVGRRPVTQYHWGGGTPTYLDVEQMKRLQGAFKAAFTLAPDAEVAIEVDPRVTTAEQLQLLAAEGFNRLSLGIQDFDHDVQVAVKRVQSVEATRGVVEAGREAGFRSVNVDLIYGLPRQTMDGFLRTVDIVLDQIRPERIALFHYAHVPWLKKHHRAIDLDAAPDAAEKLRIFTRTVAILTEYGYEYLGLDHFALPEDELARARHDRTLQRNFMGYSTRAGHDLFGLGVSSIGEVRGCFWQNERDIHDWSAKVDDHAIGVSRGYRLTADDHLRRDVIMRLMCHGEVRKAEIEAAHGVVFDETFATELSELQMHAGDGLVELRPDAIELTHLGQVFMRNVAVVFDRYFRERRQREGGTDRTFSRTL